MDPTMIIMIVAMVGIFYFLIIRPEKNKKKKLAEMRESLSVGDRVTTIGGICGKIVSIDGDHLTIESSADRVRIEITKWCISTTGKSSEEPPK